MGKLIAIRNDVLALGRQPAPHLHDCWSAAESAAVSEFEHTGCANSVLEEKGIRGARVCLFNRHSMHTSGKMPPTPFVKSSVVHLYRGTHQLFPTLVLALGSVAFTP